MFAKDLEIGISGLSLANAVSARFTDINSSPRTNFVLDHRTNLALCSQPARENIKTIAGNRSKAYKSDAILS